jgi:hypothetical protein
MKKQLNFFQSSVDYKGWSQWCSTASKYKKSTPGCLKKWTRNQAMALKANHSTLRHKIDGIGNYGVKNVIGLATVQAI